MESENNVLVGFLEPFVHCDLIFPNEYGPKPIKEVFEVFMARVKKVIFGSNYVVLEFC